MKNVQKFFFDSFRKPNPQSRRFRREFVGGKIKK